MTNSLETLRIDTPENVTFDYEVAGIGSRFLAALVDTALIGLLQVIVIGTLIVLGFELSSVSSSGSRVYWLLALLGLISFVFFWGYYIFFEALWNGQTPGKRMIGLRVIRLDGTPVSLAEVVIRNLLRILDLLPTAYGVGVVTMFITDKSRRLGDLAAGTVVVHDRKAVMLQPLSGAAAPVPLERIEAAIPEGFALERVGDQDLQIIEEFLQRRGQLVNRKQLAGHILHSLYSRLGQPVDPTSEADPEQMLAAIHQALKDRNRR